MIKEVVILGATGLVGSCVVDQLLQQSSIPRITILSRRDIQYKDKRISVKVVDFRNERSYSEALGSGDAIFCCIGTTMKNTSGDKNLYRQIDYDIPVQAARFGADKGFRQYAIVSAIGASERSGNFYLRLKGEVESTLSSLNYAGMHIFQPSLLLGSRNESRTGEGIAQRIYPALSFLLRGKLQRYRAIEARHVANAMISVVTNERKGCNTYTYKEIMQLSIA